MLKTNIIIELLKFLLEKKYLKLLIFKIISIRCN